MSWCPAAGLTVTFLFFIALVAWTVTGVLRGGWLTDGGWPQEECSDQREGSLGWGEESEWGGVDTLPRTAGWLTDNAGRRPCLDRGA